MLRQANPDIHLVQGAEISCRYTDSIGDEHEIHIPALGFDPNNSSMKDLLHQNQSNRETYIEEILYRLRCNQVDLGTYEELLLKNAEWKRLGRMQIAKEMVRREFVPSVRAAFSEYLGEYGRAYVPKKHFVTIEQAISVIREAGGQAVIGHLLSYRMDDYEMHRLVRRFKDLGGTSIETEYGRYSQHQRDALREAFALPNGLMVSCASDYHGVDIEETLDHRFHHTLCEPLLEALGITF